AAQPVVGGQMPEARAKIMAECRWWNDTQIWRGVVIPARTVLDQADPSISRLHDAGAADVAAGRAQLVWILGEQQVAPRSVRTEEAQQGVRGRHPAAQSRQPGAQRAPRPAVL